MTSEEYWEEREAQKQKKVDEITDKDVEEVDEILNRAIKGLEESIKDIYYKYAIDNKMSYFEAIQYLTDDERKEFQRDLQYYVDKYKDSEYVKQHKKELHSLSVRARVRRIDLVIAEIKKYAAELEEHLNRETRSNLDELYMEGYVRAQYETLGGNAPEINFASAFPYKKVQAALDIPWSGSNYSDKVWDTSGQFASTLQKVLMQGLVQGKHPDVIAREFRRAGFGKEELKKDGTKRKGGTAKRAEDLIRTEAAYIIEQAQKDSYIELNVEEYRFKTEMDGKQCEVCADLNDKYFKVEDAKPGTNYPPMHTRCRCTTKPKTRYDDEDESQYDLPYDEWYEKYVQPDVDKILAERAKEDMAKQIEDLTDEEKDAITRMTGGLSQSINTGIRQGADLSKYGKDMDLLDSALSKGTITEDLLLYRDTEVRFLNGYKGGRYVTEEAVKNLVGKTIKNDIYTSTSFKHLKLGARNTLIKLRVPKGTPNALYIKDIALRQFKDQEEVLFGRGLRYTIKSAKMKDGKVYLEAEVCSSD